MTTLTSCAKIVANAAPATFILKTATKTKSPTILTTHAIATKINGSQEFPSPRKIPLITLDATTNKIPAPQILI